MQIYWLKALEFIQSCKSMANEAFNQKVKEALIPKTSKLFAAKGLWLKCEMETMMWLTA